MLLNLGSRVCCILISSQYVHLDLSRRSSQFHHVENLVINYLEMSWSGWDEILRVILCILFARV